MIHIYTYSLVKTYIALKNVFCLDISLFMISTYIYQATETDGSNQRTLLPESVHSFWMVLLKGVQTYQKHISRLNNLWLLSENVQPLRGSHNIFNHLGNWVHEFLFLKIGSKGNCYIFSSISALCVSSFVEQSWKSRILPVSSKTINIIVTPIWQEKLRISCEKIHTKSKSIASVILNWRKTRAHVGFSGRLGGELNAQCLRHLASFDILPHLYF